MLHHAKQLAGVGGGKTACSAAETHFLDDGCPAPDPLLCASAARPISLAMRESR